MTKIIKPNVIDGRVDFDEDFSEGKLIIKHSQEIPDDWLMANRKQREDSMSRREGDWMPVASIPVEVVDALAREGYDVFKEPVRKTVALLKARGMDYFILTNKQV